MLRVLVKLMWIASIYNILFNILDFKAEFWQTFSEAGAHSQFPISKGYINLSSPRDGRHENARRTLKDEELFIP